MSDELGEKILAARRALAVSAEVAAKSEQLHGRVLVGLACGFSLFLGLTFDTVKSLFIQHDAVGPQPMMSMQMPENEYPLENIRVVDADTIDADIMLPLGVTLTGTRIRLSDFDAWESSKRRRTVNVTDEEVVKGKHASKLLEMLVESSQRSVLLLAEGDRDVYGRVLGRMVVYDADGQRVFVADFMDEHGMLRTEDGNDTPQEGD